MERSHFSEKNLLDKILDKTHMNTTHAFSLLAGISSDNKNIRSPPLPRQCWWIYTCENLSLLFIIVIWCNIGDGKRGRNVLLSVTLGNRKMAVHVHIILSRTVVVTTKFSTLPSELGTFENNYNPKGCGDITTDISPISSDVELL